MPSSHSLRHYLHAAVRAARAVAPLLLRTMGRPGRVATKRSRIDLVTDIDRAAEARIRRILRRACPDVGFLGEESGRSAGAPTDRWYVDPIDGTTNFVHGVPMFCTSIALVRRGIPVVGVIYDPTRPELFTAVRGQGSFLNGRRIRVSRTRRLHESLWSTGFPSEFLRAPRKYLRPFEAFQIRTHAVRRTGSAALNLAYVACGRLDGVWEDTIWPWDIAAAMVLIREAGGATTTFSGRPLRVSDTHILATNGALHETARRLHRAARRLP